jgi:glycerophosphoryl diester phosphodiesterase
MLWLLPFLSTAQYIPKFDLQGHRGARGIRPENSIPAFIAALDLGVTTIELVVVISQDKQVVVSHEPWISGELCSFSDSLSIQKGEELVGYNMYKMDYQEIRKFDCGSKPIARFPEQEKFVSHKPLLKEVIMAVEDHIKSYSQYEVDYNIEIKSLPVGDNKYHPTPEVFSKIVYDLINQYLPMERVVIQSFDFRVLKYWHKNYPHVRLAALVEKMPNPKAAREKLNTLKFNPSVYSPDMVLLDKETIRLMHNKKIRVIPWTVNEVEDMKRLKAWGVDGLITDYPNRAAEIGLGWKRNGVNKQNPSGKK